jgi:hypothetical protein
MSAPAGGQPKQVQEITVAINPEEVTALTETLSVQTTLTCVARSGHASSEPEKDVPGKQAELRVTTIETIVNGKKQTMTFTEPVPPPSSKSMDPAPAPRSKGPNRID